MVAVVVTVVATVVVTVVVTASSGKLSIISAHYALA
jgi:hypothetical protein